MKERLAWIDGLRGIAVSMVVLSHAFPRVRPGGVEPGGMGVSLFFVLSGLCLAYGPLIKRAQGRPGWFSLQAFARSRCRRILPPYYGALVLFVGISWFCTAAHLAWRMNGGQATPLPDVIVHAALLQNLSTRYLVSIDSPMWSLATEWQWYACFPVLLACALRWPRRSVTVAMAASAVWLWLPLGPFAAIAPFWVPAHLCEFVCGILVARALADGVRVSAPVTGSVAAVGLTLLLAVTPALLEIGVYYLVTAATFAALCLFMASTPRVRTLITPRPLVGLGVISYSVYLIHGPVMAQAQMLMPDAPGLVSGIVGIAVALPMSWLFHRAIERPVLRRPVPATRPAEVSIAAPGSPVASVADAPALP